MWYKSGLEGHSDNIRDSHVRESLFYSEIAPLGLLGGLRSGANVADAMRQGFDFVVMGRPLVADNGFVAKLGAEQNLIEPRAFDAVIAREIAANAALVKAAGIPIAGQ